MGWTYKLRKPAVGSRPGEGPSLVKAEQWIEFIEYWGPLLADDEPWTMFLLQSCINLHQCFVVFARRVRKNPGWGRGSTMEDTRNVVDAAEERLAQFEKGKKEIALTIMPPWAQFLVDMIEGAHYMMVRLGRDIDQIERKGHLLINIGSPLTTGFTEREDG